MKFVNRLTHTFVVNKGLYQGCSYPNFLLKYVLQELYISGNVNTIAWHWYRRHLRIHSSICRWPDHYYQWQEASKEGRQANCSRNTENENTKTNYMPNVTICDSTNTDSKDITTRIVKLKRTIGSTNIIRRSSGTGKKTEGRSLSSWPKLCPKFLFTYFIHLETTCDHVILTSEIKLRFDSPSRIHHFEFDKPIIANF